MLSAEANKRADAVQWLSAEFSASRDEMLRAQGPMLTDAIVSLGYAREQRGRYAVTDAGRAFLEDARGPAE